MPATLPRPASFNFKRHFLDLTVLLSALVIMSACGSSKSSMMNPNANNAASSAKPTASSGSVAGPTAPKPEVMITGDYVPELPAPAGEIYSYRVNLTNGAITEVGSNGDNGTAALAVNHANTLLYTSELGPTMAVYSIGGTGSLTFLFDTVNIRAHSFEGRVAIHPNDQFVYSGAYTEGVIGYRAEPDGTMTELAGDPMQPESFMAGFVPSGKWLFGVSTPPSGGGAVIPYQVNSQTGALAAGTAIRILTSKNQFTFGDALLDPQGKFLFVSDQASNAIYTFSVDAQTGKAVQIGATFTGTEVPGRITISPNDKFLYVGSASNPDILGYSIAQNGKLSPINGGKAFALGSPNFGGIRGLKVDLTGGYLYANTVFYTNGLSINPNSGNLTSIMSPLFDSGNELTDVTFASLR